MFGFENRSSEDNAPSYDASGLSEDYSVSATEKGTIAEGGLAVGILKEIYYSSKRHVSLKGENRSNNARGKITVALSAWILRGQHVIE